MRGRGLGKAGRLDRIRPDQPAWPPPRRSAATPVAHERTRAGSRQSPADFFAIALAGKPFASGSKRPPKVMWPRAPIRPLHRRPARADRDRIRVRPCSRRAWATPGAGSGEVAVGWAAVPRATGYRVIRTTAAGAQLRVVADFTITTGRIAAAPEVVNVWSAQHSYVPDRGRLTQLDRSGRFEYVDVGTGRRYYRVLAYNSAGSGPLSAVTGAIPPGGTE